MNVADRLFERRGDETWLIGGRDRATGAVRFPFPEGGEADRFEMVRLPSTGALWSWTVQRFEPKAPYRPHPGRPFAPYGVGYVQLGDALVVEGRIVTDDLDGLHLGQPMKVTTETFTATVDGEPVQTYAFTPISDEAGQ